MKRGNLRNILIATIVFVGVSVLGLWAWNTLAELFGGPEARYQHALAFLVLLGIVRFALSAPRRKGNHGHRIRHASAESGS